MSDQDPGPAGAATGAVKAAIHQSQSSSGSLVRLRWTPTREAALKALADRYHVVVPDELVQAHGSNWTVCLSSLAL